MTSALITKRVKRSSKNTKGDRIGAKCTMGRALISWRSIPGGLIGGVFETRLIQPDASLMIF